VIRVDPERVRVKLIERVEQRKNKKPVIAVLIECAAYQIQMTMYQNRIASIRRKKAEELEVKRLASEVKVLGYLKLTYSHSHLGTLKLRNPRGFS